MSRADNLPRWAYLLLTAACVAMGIWASYITLQYFEHGAKALETDAAHQALAVSAALMFVASEMGAFTLAALLTERQLWARRWLLTGFAACVLGLEVVTIVAVQLALTLGAEMTQSTTATQEHDLRARITALEASAASKRATADKQRATARDGYELKLSARSSTAATEEQGKTDALYQQLAAVQAQKRPTLAGMLGRDNAIYYAVARGILVSLGGLVFFGTAGALLRAARGGASGSVPGTIAPAQTAAPAEPVAPVAPATTVVTPSVSYGKTMLAGAGALAAMAAPVAHAMPANSAAESVQAGAAESVQASAAVSVQKPRAKRAASVKVDTGVEGKAGARYMRVKAGIKAGKIKPTQRGIMEAEGGSQAVVQAYLEQLANDGVIIKAGRGYALANKKVGAA